MAFNRNNIKAIAIQFYDTAKELGKSDKEAIEFVDRAFEIMEINAITQIEIEGEAYTEEIRNDILADMEQKYHKVWKSVHLTAHFIGTMVILQVIGDRGYVIKEIRVNPMTNTDSRRRRFQMVLNSLNGHFGTNFSLADITCVKF